MRGLTIIVADISSERFRAALGIAAAQAALGGEARIFCQGEAVALLRSPVADEDLVETALGLGVALIACQSGIDLANTDAGTLDARIVVGGLVGVMATLGEDRLIVV